MEDINSSEELKNLVYPALTFKMKELRKSGYRLIDQDDIWNLLINFVWKNKNNIALCDIVDDILNYNNTEIYNYYMEVMENNNIIRLPKIEE